jgi:hypothetical protein
MTKNSENAQIIREMINKEADLINHRLTWLSTFQGFLFTALGLVWKDGHFVKDLHFFVPTLIGVGFLSSLSVLLSLRVAHKAIRKLLDDWDKSTNVGGASYSGPDVIGYRSRLTYLLPWFVLPFILVVAWFYIGVMSYVGKLI